MVTICSSVNRVFFMAPSVARGRHSLKLQVVRKSPGRSVKVAVDFPDLEITVIGSQPAVDNFSDLDLGPREPDASRRFLASVTCIALHVNSIGGVSSSPSQETETWRCRGSSAIVAIDQGRSSYGRFLPTGACLPV